MKKWQEFFSTGNGIWWILQELVAESMQTKVQVFDSLLSSNPTSGSFVVWPGTLFPNSRGNEAAANLSL